MTNTLTDTEKSKDLSRLLDISLTMIEKTDLSSLLSLIIEDAYRNPLFKIFIEKKVYRNTFPGIENPDYRHKR